MRLHNIQPVPGAKHRTKRYGRGRSSGHGKTSGRGGKGQTARSGSSIRHGFEGGQTPLYRRLPKRGFNNARFKRKVAVVNLRDLEAFPEGAVVDAKALADRGLIRGRFDAIKILGSGGFGRKLTVRAALFSESARKKIEAAGGKAEVPEPAKGA
ncbi:MAG: 50S ribosomal protein L15 [Verrucomicrobiae bacterium]|nr:50S ribosomal protein L15 [Verrucomicrobiae bacterium]